VQKSITRQSYSLTCRRYLQNLELYETEKPYWCFLPPHEGFDPDEQRVDNLEFEGHNVAITDIRGLNDDVSLESYGFQVLSHNTEVLKFTSADAVEAYKRETERLLTEVLGATHVKCYDLRLRKNVIFQRTEFDLNNPLHTEGPAQGAHNGEGRLVVKPDFRDVNVH
jgi:hypothetical protein